jgi:hypothetical protein
MRSSRWRCGPRTRHRDPPRTGQTKWFRTETRTSPRTSARRPSHAGTPRSANPRIRIWRSAT